MGSSATQECREGGVGFNESIAEQILPKWIKMWGEGEWKMNCTCNCQLSARASAYLRPRTEDLQVLQSMDFGVKHVEYCIRVS